MRHSTKFTRSPRRQTAPASNEGIDDSIQNHEEIVTDEDFEAENSLILPLTSDISVECTERVTHSESNNRSGRSTRVRSVPNILRESIEEGRVFTRVTDFSHDLHMCERLFSRTTMPGQEVHENSFPSSNILVIVVYQAYAMIGDGTTPKDMKITDPDWNIQTISIEGTAWYYAVFSGSDLALVRRTSKLLPAWLKETDTSRARPTTIAGALRCVSPSAGIDKEKIRSIISLDGKGVHLVFESVEMAVRMESAFWLERQFSTTKRHWYQHLNIHTMAIRLNDAYLAEKRRND